MSETRTADFRRKNYFENKNCSAKMFKQISNLRGQTSLGRKSFCVYKFKKMFNVLEF